MDLPLVIKSFVFVWKFLVAAVIFLFSLAPQLSLELIPYLLLIFLVLRLLQFITHNRDTFKNVTQFKHLIRTCLFIALFTVQCGISLNLVSCQPHQDWFPFDLHKLALHQSKKNYILARYVCSFVVYFLVHDFGIKQAYDGNNLPAIQALTEIIDCIIIFWEDNIFSLDLDYSPRLLVEDRPIETKYILAAQLKHSGSLKLLAAVLVRYDLFILCIEVVVCYVLRNLFKRSCRSPQQRATSTIEGCFYRKQAVYFVNGTKNTLGFFFCFLLVYKVCSCFLAYKITTRFEILKDLEDLTYNILFLFFILWIIKTIVLLAWESCTIYDRLRSKILSASEQLYFLGILDCLSQNIFNLQHTAADQTTDEGTNTKDESLTGRIIQVIIQAINVVVDIVQTSSLMSLYGVTAKQRWMSIKRNQIRDELLWKKHCDPTLDDLQQMAQTFLGAKRNLSDNYFSAILTLIERKAKTTRNIRKTLYQLISWGNEYQEDGNDFVGLLLKINADMRSDNSRTRFVPKKSKQKKMEPVSLTDFRTWMEKARDNVIWLENTLKSSKETTEDLNKVMSVFLIGGTVMAWLKVPKIAEISKESLLIASPFLAAPIFLIKDTLKDSFERFFFIYVFHPFDIGDICLINDKKMEVVAMRLWTTTFIAIDENGKRKRRERVIYHNSQLAKQNIKIYQSLC